MALIGIIYVALMRIFYPLPAKRV
jgi:hypothetical protein